MTFVCRLSFVFFAFLQFQAFAQSPKVVTASTTSKELKRTAHRLRIPVDQLKNARQALQEATDLVSRIDPSPTDQLNSLAQSWQNLNRSKSKSIISSFIQDLRFKAAQSANYSSYQRATSAAMSLIQLTAESDYEKAMEMIRGWPDPPASLGEAAVNYLKTMESQAKSQSLSRLANSDPEKAYDVLSQPGGIEPSSYSISGQTAQRLMSMGKKDDALKLIDQTMADFKQHSSDSQALQGYENFVRTAAMVDSTRGGIAVSQLVAQMVKQPQPSACTGKLKSGDASVDLTCTESRVLSILHNFSSKPGVATEALNSLPGLRSKLDGIGGVDGFFGSITNGSGLSITYGSTVSAGGSGFMSSAISVSSSSNLLQELQGKSETNPGLVKEKLRSLAKGPEDIDKLISLANSAASRDPELASLALKMAEPWLPQIESVQKRASTLQNMIRAYRQADGEVDVELLKTGFIIADQLRQEQIERQNRYLFSTVQIAATTPADQLEAFLVAELSRDSFDSAIRYVRTLDDGTLKLMSFIQIVQALSQSNF